MKYIIDIPDEEGIELYPGGGYIVNSGHDVVLINIPPDKLEKYKETEPQNEFYVKAGKLDIDKMVSRVIQDQREVEIEMTPEGYRVSIQPWKPFEYKCPYGKDGTCV